MMSYRAMNKLRLLTTIMLVAAVSASLPQIPKQTNSLLSKKSLPSLDVSLADQLSEDSDVVVTVRPQVESLRGGASVISPSLLNTLKVGFYFALWYSLNIVYNIVNKKVLNVLPAPITVGSLQVGVGALYSATLWLLRLRAIPSLTTSGRKDVRTVGFWHCAGQLFTMLSLGAGPVSFTHIVKALEPFFSALVSALCFGKWMHPNVYLTLIPVVGGVGYACLKERSFSWLAFSMAMGSNVAFALRAVLSKMAMTSSSVGTNITSPNMFGLVTCSAFWLSIPFALLTEGRSFLALWDSAVKASEKGPLDLARGVFLSGLFHYLNNEVMYLALGNVHPVTLAVGNTMKRVFIMVASVMVFRNEITIQAAIGSAIGISGVLLYSLTKQYYEGLEAMVAKGKLKGRNVNQGKMKKK